MTSRVAADRRGNVLRLVLSDGPTRNSLSEAMMAELTESLKDAGEDRSVGAIVIAAEGHVFSSGHNLKELTAHRDDADRGVSYFEKIFASCAQLMLTISHHRCAVIAEVNGLASAAGCQLVAAADLAYASPSAGFCTPGVNIGLFCSTPMVALSRAVSQKQAMEMLLLGGVHDADFAMRIGLVNAVVSGDKLSMHVMDVAAHIASKSQAAIHYGKRSFYEQRAMHLTDAYAYASSVMVKNMLDGAACEGLDAFIGKREPKWPPLA